MIGPKKWQGGVVQDICPDIVQASGSYALAVLTEIRVEVRQAQVAVGGKVD
jgi:hypothetical protein